MMYQTQLWTYEELNPNASRTKQSRVYIPINILSDQQSVQAIHEIMTQLQYVHTVRELASVPGFLSWHSTAATPVLFVQVYAIYKIPQTSIYIKATYETDRYTIHGDTREFLEYVEGSVYQTHNELSLSL